MRFDYPNHVDVERGVLTEDAYGTTQARTWAVLHRHIACKVRSISGNEAVQYSTEQAAATHIMSCGWCDIQTSDRVVWGLRKLNVIASITNELPMSAMRQLKVVLEEVESRGE